MHDDISSLSEFVTGNPKDFANICFWIVTLILATVTYRNAKKTLFNPIRSEMVKYQMKVITEFIDNHTSKGQNFDNSIDYSNLLKLNYETDYLFSILTDENEFNSHNFDENENYMSEFCTRNLGGLFEISLSGEKLNLELVSGDFNTAKLYVQTRVIKDKELDNGELTLQRFYLTNKFYTFYADLLNLKSNPFIPQKIKDSIDCILRNIYSNVIILHELLSFHISKQTEARYQLIYSQFTERKIDHQKDLDILRKSISLYFKVNI